MDKCGQVGCEAFSFSEGNYCERYVTLESCIKFITANKEAKVKEENTMEADASMEDMLKEFRELKDQKDALTKEAKALNPAIEYLQGAIITKMQGEGVDKVSTPFGSASIKTDIYPQIKDFPAFIHYIETHKAYELIQKRVNAGPYRELIVGGEEISGLGEYEDTKLNFRRKG